MSTTNRTTILSDKDMQHRSAQSADQLRGTASLDLEHEILLVVRGMIERVLLKEGMVLRLGRFDLGEEDTLNLTPYGALERGVSRVHAQLHVEDNHLYLTDLESSNGTYLLGKRLEPNVPVMLRQGDEALLARLPIQFMLR